MFFFSNGLTFDLWRLKFGVYNWTPRHADSGFAAKVERQPELQEIEALNYCPSVVLQKVFLCSTLDIFDEPYGLNISRLINLFLSQTKGLKLAVCRKRQAKCL